MNLSKIKLLYARFYGPGPHMTAHMIYLFDHEIKIICPLDIFSPKVLGSFCFYNLSQHVMQCMHFPLGLICVVEMQLFMCVSDRNPTAS